MTAQQKLQPSQNITAKLYHVQREKSRKELKIMENNKLKEAKNKIIQYLMDMKFTVAEAEEVLQMCSDDINAAVRRSRFNEIKKDGDE